MTDDDKTDMLTLPARVSRERIEQVRRAAFWTGQTMVDLIDQALEREVARLEKKHGRKGKGLTRAGYFKAIPEGEQLQRGRRAGR